MSSEARWGKQTARGNTNRGMRIEAAAVVWSPASYVVQSLAKSRQDTAENNSTGRRCRMGVRNTPKIECPICVLH